MAINTLGPANKKSGNKKGAAKHAMEKKSHFDTSNDYAPFSKTKVGGAAEGTVRAKGKGPKGKK